MKYAYIGCWGADITTNAAQPQGNGGVKVYRVTDEGEYEFINQAGEQINVGMMSLPGDGRYLYTNDERKDFGGIPGNGGGVAAFEIDFHTGAVRFLNAVSSGGAYPNYIVTDRQRRYAFVCHHGHHDDVITRSVQTGEGVFIGKRYFDEASVAMFPILKDGRIGGCCDLKILTGSSINERDQWTAHAHCVILSPDERFVFIADKGSDVIKVFKIDYEQGKLWEAYTLKTEKGMQPRHMVFHPLYPVLYVCSEAAGFVCAYDYDAATGCLEFLDREKTVPENFNGDVGPADIKVHHSGKFLYVSNRGHNTIGCLKLDDRGKMSLFDCVPCGGANPRGMNFDWSKDILYVVNMSGNITPFAVNTENGKLCHTQRQLYVKTPLYIQFLETKEDVFYEKY